MTEAKKPDVCLDQVPSVPPAQPATVNHQWVRNLVSACTSGNSHGNDVSDHVLCHRMAFQINKHFGLETRQYNTDLDPERDAAFVDPYTDICSECGQTFAAYIHNLPEGRDDIKNHEFVPAQAPETQPVPQEEPKIDIHCDIFQALMSLVAINERGIDPFTVLQEAQFVVQEVLAGRMDFDTVTPGDEPRIPTPSAGQKSVAVPQKDEIWELKKQIQVSHNLLRSEFGRDCALTWRGKETPRKCTICREVEATMQPLPAAPQKESAEHREKGM